MLRKVIETLKNSDGFWPIKFRKDGKKSNPQVTVKFRPLRIALPANSAALADWHKSKVTTFGAGANKVTFRGTEAAAASKCLHDIEGPIRGSARKMLEEGKSAAEVQDWLDTMQNWWPGTKAVVVEVRPITIDQNKVAALFAAGDLEGLNAYLTSMGANVTSEQETTDEVVDGDDEDEDEELSDEELIRIEQQRLADEADLRIEERERQAAVTQG